MARRKRHHAFDQSQRFADGAEKQIRGNRHGRDTRGNAAARQQRTHFRGEKQFAVHQRVVERLDAHAVARQEDARRPSAATLRHLDDGKREHSVQVLGAALAPFLVRVDDDFRIGARAKFVTGGLKLRAKTLEIVDLAVVDDCEGAGFVPDGLAAAGKINDAEAAHPYGDGRGEQNSFLVRAAMDHCGHHAAHDGLARLPRFDSDDAADSAHQSPASRNEMRAIVAPKGCNSSARLRAWL